MSNINPFKLAESVRYVDDIKKDNDFNIDSLLLEEHESFQSHQSININKDMTPGIYNSLKTCLSNLNFPIEKVNSYVYPSSEVNAACFQGSNDKTIIKISSSLINLLTEKELVFVLGHELGHSLLSHTKSLNKQESSMDLLYARAAEISVDRIGLLASKDLTSCLKAIIKSSSGLDDKHIRFDVSAFLNQLRKTSTSSSSILQHSTHPSFLLRAKSLLRFSMSDKYMNFIGKDGGKSLIQLDDLIKKDLKQYIDGSIYDDFEYSLKITKLWVSIAKTVQDNKIDNEEKEKLISIFGQDLIKKAFGLLKGYTKVKVNQTVKSKILESYNKLKAFDPENVDEHFTKIKNEVSTIFK